MCEIFLDWRKKMKQSKIEKKNTIIRDIKNLFEHEKKKIIRNQ